FTINGSQQNNMGASLFGSKFDDVNGNGIREGGGATGTPGPISLSLYSLFTPGLVNPYTTTIAYDDVVQAMLVAVTTQGVPNHPVQTVLYQVQSTGAYSIFATLPGVRLGDGAEMAVVPQGNSAGFTPGDVFLPVNINPNPNTTGAQIMRLGNNGSTVTNPWVTLPNTTGAAVYQVYLDNTGVFGNKLLALTSTGQIWQISADGTTTRLFPSVTVFGDNFITVPNTPSLYGPLAGKILVVAEQPYAGANAPATTVDSAGNVAHPAGLDNISSVTTIPTAKVFIGTTDFNNSIY